jgi:hypothetical protein
MPRRAAALRWTPDNNAEAAKFARRENLFHHFC